MNPTPAAPPAEHLDPSEPHLVALEPILILTCQCGETIALRPRGKITSCPKCTPPAEQPAEATKGDGAELPSERGVWTREEIDGDQRYEIMVRDTGWSGWLGNKAASGTRLPSGHWFKGKK
jgi:hypothetical protein